jgi:hypothetical protein
LITAWDQINTLSAQPETVAKVVTIPYILLLAQLEKIAHLVVPIRPHIKKVHAILVIVNQMDHAQISLKPAALLKTSVSTFLVKQIQTARHKT